MHDVYCILLILDLSIIYQLNYLHTHKFLHFYWQIHWHDAKYSRRHHHHHYHLLVHHRSFKNTFLMDVVIVTKVQHCCATMQCHYRSYCYIWLSAFMQTKHFTNPSHSIKRCDPFHVGLNLILGINGLHFKLHLSNQMWDVKGDRIFRP
jgi:hypothetical protein